MAAKKRKRCSIGRSGDADNPRILGAFNEPTPDWLAFFMFTFFTDRDGKFQLSSLAESGFDPLARTCRFMLTEEAHHMFVGETGVSRIIQRTCEVMKENKIDDPADVRALGVIDLQTIQRYLNFHCSVTTRSLWLRCIVERGELLYLRTERPLRGNETQRRSHRWPATRIRQRKCTATRSSRKNVPALTALNERLRDDYIGEIQAGVNRWNRNMEQAGIPFRLKLPHKGFHRAIGNFAGHYITPEGEVVSEEAWKKNEFEWLPSSADYAYRAIADERARGGTRANSRIGSRRPCAE